MGEKSGPREFNKKSHAAFLKNHPRRRPGKKGTTVYIWKGGELVEKQSTSGLEILPISGGPLENVLTVDYEAYHRRVVNSLRVAEKDLGR